MIYAYLFSILLIAAQFLRNGNIKIIIVIIYICKLFKIKYLAYSLENSYKAGGFGQYSYVKGSYTPKNISIGKENSYFKWAKMKS